MRYQLRQCRLEPGSLDQFVEEWRGGVLPLRREFGFEVLGAWVDPEKDCFVWVIRHEDFETADQTYYGSPQRQALDPNPARLIVEARTRFVEPVEL